MIGPDAIRGKLFPAVPVPRGADGRYLPDAQARYVDHLKECPIGGVAVWAHTGRGLRLGEAERGEILTSWREGLGPDRIVIAAAGAGPPIRHPDDVFAAARSMAVQAAGLGAEAILVHPPVAFRGRPDRDRLVLEYHSAVAETGLPLLLFYLYEAAGGISYGPEVLAQLLGRPEVLGIKLATLDSVMTFQQVAALVRDRAPDKLVVTGEDRFLGYSLMCGAQAALIGMGAACARLQADLIRSYLDGDSGRFLALNDRVDVLAQHTFVAPMEGYVLRMLWCLVHQGILPPEAAHDPWGPPLPRAEFDRLGECLGRIGEQEPRS